MEVSINGFQSKVHRGNRVVWSKRIVLSEISAEISRVCVLRFNFKVSKCFGLFIESEAKIQWCPEIRIEVILVIPKKTSPLKSSFPMVMNGNATTLSFFSGYQKFTFSSCIKLQDRFYIRDLISTYIFIKVSVPLLKYR